MLIGAVCWRRPLRFRQHSDAMVITEDSKQEDGSGFDSRFYEEFLCPILITIVSCLSTSVCGGGPGTPPQPCENICQSTEDGLLKCILEELFEHILVVFANRTTPLHHTGPLLSE